MTKSKHTLDYCAGCKKIAVRCITCKNWLCTNFAGIINGNPCVDCYGASEDYIEYLDDPTSIEFSFVSNLVLLI